MTRSYPTIYAALASQRGIGPGFDILRLGLACAIFYGHVKWIAGSSTGPDEVARALIGQGASINEVQAAAFDSTLWGSIKRVYHLAIIPMFFALSGFLVTGSAERVKALKPFLAFRLLRILPALTVEVVLSALLLGPIFTTVTLNDYFRDQSFFQYFGNIFGIVKFELPGVFVENPVSGIVNRNLWTLPSEFYCYIISAALIAGGLFFKGNILLVIMALITFLLIFGSIFFDFCVNHKNIYDTNGGRNRLVLGLTGRV